MLALQRAHAHPEIRPTFGYLQPPVAFWADHRVLRTTAVCLERKPEGGRSEQARSHLTTMGKNTPSSPAPSVKVWLARAVLMPSKTALAET